MYGFFSVLAICMTYLIGKLMDWDKDRESQIKDCRKCIEREFMEKIKEINK